MKRIALRQSADDLDQRSQSLAKQRIGFFKPQGIRIGRHGSLLTALFWISIFPFSLLPSRMPVPSPLLQILSAFWRNNISSK
jgi:hypothetical protein